MNTLGRISETVRESLDVLAEGWQELWTTARHAITRFTPEESHRGSERASRWGLLSADMRESEDNFEVALEAPGMSKDNFDIRIIGTTLIVRGTKTSETSSEVDRDGGHYHITERAFGRFERHFDLPAEVDEAATAASYRGGVLTISLKKSGRAKPRVIAITD